MKRTIEGKERDIKVNKKELLKKFEKEWADTEIEKSKEIEENPLSQYSTTQIKKELRRRKGR